MVVASGPDEDESFIPTDAGGGGVFDEASQAGTGDSEILLGPRATAYLASAPGVRRVAAALNTMVS
jgi:hypothetical protein